MSKDSECTATWFHKWGKDVATYLNEYGIVPSEDSVPILLSIVKGREHRQAVELLKAAWPTPEEES